MIMRTKTTPTSLKMVLIVVLVSISFGAAAQQQPADRDDALLAYAQCMRENGYPEFPDPTAGRLQMQVNPGTAPRYRAAQEACRDLAPEGLAADGVSAEQMDALLALSGCMRENGVADFPDPDAEGRLNLSGTSINPQSPTVRSAMDVCMGDGGRAGVPIQIIR